MNIVSDWIHHQDYAGLFAEIKDILSPWFDVLDLVIIFGSVAEKNAVPYSDIDILIVGSKPIKAEIKDVLAEYSSHHGTPFDLLFFNPDQFQLWKSSSVIQQALKDGVIIWKKTNLIE